MKTRKLFKSTLVHCQIRVNDILKFLNIIFDIARLSLELMLVGQTVSTLPGAGTGEARQTKRQFAPPNTVEADRHRRTAFGPQDGPKCWVQLLGDPKVTAHIYCKSRNLPNTDTQNYSTDLR